MMWIPAGSLLLALAISLDCIEFVYSEPVTLEDLFPGYKGVMPPVEEIQYEHQSRNFQTFDNKRITEYPGMTFLKRDRMIIGWLYGLRVSIGNPCYLFPLLEDVFIAFNMDEDRWINLTRDLSKKLGVKRYHPFVVARDEVAATHVTTSTNPLYKEAHIRACKEANNRADIVEQEQEGQLRSQRTTPENSIRIIKEEYSQAYNRTFMLHLHFSGDYSIHGLRRKHPQNKHK